MADFTKFSVQCDERSACVGVLRCARGTRAQHESEHAGVLYAVGWCEACK